MTFLVAVKGTGTPAAYPPGSTLEEGDPAHIWKDEGQAQARCEKANQEAKKLGIKTRYEVTPA